MNPCFQGPSPVLTIPSNATRGRMHDDHKREMAGICQSPVQDLHMTRTEIRRQMHRRHHKGLDTCWQTALTSAMNVSSKMTVVL